MKIPISVTIRAVLTMLPGEGPQQGRAPKGPGLRWTIPAYVENYIFLNIFL